MKSSCTEEAAIDVNRGAAFLMALAPLDARRAFERAVERDPDCALAGWGHAMSWLPVDPWRMSQQALREGRDAVRRAAGRGTPREQAYVKSAAALFDDRRAPAAAPVPTAAARPLSRRDAQSGGGVRRRSGRDDRVRARDAVAVHRAGRRLRARSRDDHRAAVRRRVQPGQSRLRARPDQRDNLQLGAALTLLLARDGPTLADTAKGAADAVARMATLPLARYLPTRTYTRLGEWTAAAASAEAAIKLAGTPASPELVTASTGATWRGSGSSKRICSRAASPKPTA